jgi:predicted transcriptional regulator of viral defense system
MDRVDAAIGALARQQHGVFTCAQSSSLGMTDKQRLVRLHQGVYEHVHPDVLRVAGAPETWKQRVAIAVFAAGPGAAASHETAGALHRMDRCGTASIHVTVPKQRRLRVLQDVRTFRKHDLHPVDVAIVDGIPTTTPARTLVDLAAIFGYEKLQEVVDSAIRDGMTSKSRLWWRWGALRRRGRNGVAKMGRLLERIDGEPVPRSVLERRFMRLIADLDIPPVVTQHVIKRPDGSHVATVDFAIPPLKIIFEVVGHGTHSTRTQRRNDSVRRNDLAALGQTVYEFTYEQVCFEGASVRATVLRAVLWSLRAA